jgi:ribose transport system substrate-binding protein
MKPSGRTAVVLAALAAVIAVAAGGCRPRAAAHEKRKLALGVCMSTFASPYSSATIREFARYAPERGCELILVDSQLDIQREASNIDNLIALGADAILVNVVDSKGSRAALKKAARAGIAVICFGSSVNAPETLGVRAYTGPAYYKEAEAAAEVVLKHRPHGNAVMIAGTPGYSAAIDREKGFTETIARHGAAINILDIQTANWMREDAQRVMADYITKYGRQIDIVYSQDDNMTAGAVAALQAAGYTLQSKPYVASIGAMADGLPLVANGWIDSTIMQSPKEDCHLAVDTAIAVAQGKQAEPFKAYYLDTPPVDKANVQQVIDMHLWDD